jgi:hypothetical protein
MEILKKTIQRVMTTGTTTGCTECYVIIPDINIYYTLKVCLTQEAQDMGFFDAYTTGNTVVEGETTLSGTLEGTTITPTVVTGVAATVGVFMGVSGNKVTNTGGSPIVEYGIIASETYTTNATLLYDNSNFNIKKTSIANSIDINVTYTLKMILSQFAGNKIYFRAFARNAEEKIGYGMTIYYLKNQSNDGNGELIQ